MLVADLIKEGDSLVVKLIGGFRREQVSGAEAEGVKAVFELVKALMEDLLHLRVGDLLTTVELKEVHHISVLDEQSQEDSVIQSFGILVTPEDGREQTDQSKGVPDLVIGRFGARAQLV